MIFGTTQRRNEKLTPHTTYFKLLPHKWFFWVKFNENNLSIKAKKRVTPAKFFEVALGYTNPMFPPKWVNIPVDNQGELLNKINIAPDWVIYILSPSQNLTKVTKNILFCLKNGSQLGWLIDPEDKSILVYYPDKVAEYFEKYDDKLPIPNFIPELNLTVGDIFNWLKY